MNLFIKKIFIAFSFFTFLAGGFWYIFQRELLLFNFSRSLTKDYALLQSNKKTVTLYYWKNNTNMQEQICLLLSNDIRANLETIISRWLQLIIDEDSVTQKMNLQSVLLSYDEAELFISFDRLGWSNQKSIFEKWMLLETLLQTIRMQTNTVKKVRILVNHKPAQDAHLDFTNAWPITGFLS